MIKKAFYLLIIAVLALVLLLPACAAPKPPVTTPPPTPTTPPPAATPPSATPPAAAPVAIKTSFEAKTYTNSYAGFSFMYPEGWTQVKTSEGQVFRAIAALNMANCNSTSANVIPEAADLGTAIKNAYNNDIGLQFVPVKVDSIKATTLADGKTAANEVIISGTTPQGSILYGYILSTNRGGKTIFITANTFAGDNDKALMREIARTLTIIKK